jgi:hypothetical protein
MIVSQNAVSCPECGRVLVAPERVVEGTVVASSSSASIPVSESEVTTTDVSSERRNRLARQRPHVSVIGALARFVQEAWNEPVVRVAAGAALLALGERLADRLTGADRGRRASTREYTQSSPQRNSPDTARQASEDRSLVPYSHPGEVADRGYIGSVVETIIIIRRTLRR